MKARPETPMDSRRHFTDALRIADIRFFIGATAFFTLASRALAVVIGFQIYRITRNPLSLGWLGLIEAIPALSLVLFGGYVADHFNRKRILLITRAVSCICAAGLAVISLRNGSSGSLAGLYTVIFLAGIARGFADPANTAFEAQIVPKHLTVNAASWISSTWVTCAVVGPAAIGFAFDAWGAARCYLLILGSFALSWICTLALTSKTQPVPEREPVLQSIASGWKFVFSNQPLLAALALDLFAVLFGGAVALLPIYAEDILHVGAKGLGLLNAAPMVGALGISLAATHRPPIGKAGRNLLLAVSGFGVSIIVFAFSKNFWLSMTALFFSGVFDGVSVVIRRSMVRLLSPDALRGRIAAANWVFICSSNELGAFESGTVAAWIGTVPCVALGGMMTLMIVAGVAILAPQLRGLRFDVRTLEREHPVTDDLPPNQPAS